MKRLNAPRKRLRTLQICEACGLACKKETTSLDKQRPLLHIKCGAIEGRGGSQPGSGHPTQATRNDGDDTQTDTDENEDEAGTDVTRQRNQISFDDEAFTQGAKLLPAIGREACANCSRKCELQDSDVPREFWYFLWLYFSAQGCAAADRHISPDDHEAPRRKEILKLGTVAGTWTPMDSFTCRGHPKLLALSLLAKQRRTAKDAHIQTNDSIAIGKYLLPVCVDAYGSSPNLLRCLGELKRLYNCVEDVDDLDSADRRLVVALRLATNLRTDESAGFHTYGGRRRMFGTRAPVTQDVVWQSRLLDNLIHVLPMWAASGAIATAIVALAGRLQGLSPSSGSDPCQAEVNDLMSAILALPLLGRPSQTNPTKARGLENYFGKNVLSRVWFMLAFLVCESGELRSQEGPKRKSSRSREPREHRINSQCDCKPCGKLRYLRDNVSFFGPSPVTLFAQLRRSKQASLPETWRILRQHVAEHFENNVDLLLMQSLPCAWRVYSRFERCMRNAPLEWIRTRYRCLTAQVFGHESDDTNSMFAKLTLVDGGTRTFIALTPQDQRRMLDTFRQRANRNALGIDNKDLPAYSDIVKRALADMPCER